MMTRLAARRWVDRTFWMLIGVSTIVAIVPLLALLSFVVVRGIPGLLNPAFFIEMPHPVGVPGGGVANAIVGTLIIVGMASLVAVPFGVLVGIFLSEFGQNRLGDSVRFASDVLTGMPSITFGIFAYTVLVVPLHRPSALAGAAALAFLMLPLILRATESALLLVSQALREAGLALGVPRWRVTLEIVVPAALGAIVTGALLAMARATGETAPLLFTALGNEFFQLNPTQPMAALSLIVFKNGLAPWTNLQNQAWAAALLLVIMVSVSNILARVFVRRVQG